MHVATTRCRVQGKTCRDKHILLLDTSHMRTLIVGMSRATHGKYVHVATPFDEERLLVVRHEELDLDHDIMCSGLGKGLDLDNMCSEHVVGDDDWGRVLLKNGEEGLCVQTWKLYVVANINFTSS